MVWFEYHLESYHGDSVIKGPLSPTSPKSPKSPRVDPRRMMSEEDAVELYFFMKQVCIDMFYEGCLLNKPEFNSFSLEDVINTRRFREPIEDEYFYTEVWIPTYRMALNILFEYTNRQLAAMGKRISFPKKLFNKFIFHFSDKFITQT